MSTESGSSWIQSVSDRSPRAYFEAFDIYVKQHGHQRYTQAIQDSNLDKDTKQELMQNFAHWKVNDGVQFWLDRQSQSSQMTIASTLVKGSESLPKTLFILDNDSIYLSQTENGKKRSLVTTFVENPQKTPRRRVAPSPTPRISTTSMDSPNIIQSTHREENPFVDDVDEDDFMIPDTETSYCFSAILDGLDVGGSFGQLFQDHFEDHDFDRAKCLGFLLPCAPDKNLFLDFIDTTNLAGKATNSRKEPDLGLDIKDDANKTICNVGIAEVTSIAQKGCKKKNAKDLVRVGEMLKNALDRLQDDFGITDAVVPGWQVIAQVMSIYIMFRCGNLYILVYVKDVTIPDNLTDLKTMGVDIKTWLELEATISFGLRSSVLP
ncbi:hypothetical protein KI688_004553 [Linnemannia hyalina]|uniref:Uncharacterized protein n=1 Tax=Linnemannia hyalina TaxID=64524 RepID=A0A9P7XMQ9_9FUNG|nr:hypothetical protein KI688_004553 [Linnemannia hyalina]